MEVNGPHGEPTAVEVGPASGFPGSGRRAGPGNPETAVKIDIGSACFKSYPKPLGVDHVVALRLDSNVVALKWMLIER
jgi:hypothetical protein